MGSQQSTVRSQVHRKTTDYNTFRAAEGEEQTVAVGVDRSTAKRAVIVGAVGNLLEWYDFAVYGFLASTIATLFFPSDDRMASLLASFAVFAVGFFARPLGGLIFGHYGDKLGRRVTLAASIILMATSTFLLGVLPTYAQVGILAPILLVVIRVIQGLSAGGEWGGSASFLVEFAPASRRGFYGSWQQFTVVGGFLLGSGTSALLTSVLSEDAFLSWGWRLPFLFGIVLGVVGLYLRLAFAEDTPEFRKIEIHDEVARVPILATFRNNLSAMLTSIGYTFHSTVAFYIFLSYMPTYVSEQLGLPLSQALTSNAIGLVLLITLIPVMGALSDRIGRRPLVVASSIGFAVLTYPLFVLMSDGGFLIVLFVQLIFATMYAPFSGPTPATMVEMFPTNVRYSALSVSYNIAVAAFGGTAPFIATFLISRTGSDLAPTFYVILAATVTTLVIWRMKETAKIPLQST
jgi:MFS transporter, MHS family, proline/betaine transporter